MSAYFNEKTKSSVKKVVASCKDKRELVFKDLELSEEEFKKQVTEIRKKPFEDFEKNLKIAKDNFKKRGFVVHELGVAKDTSKILKEILGDSKIIARSKTNTGRELDLDGALKDFENFETDLGDFLVEMFQEDDQHYVLPAIHLDAESVAKKVQEVYGEKIEASPEKLTRFLCDKIRERILTADTGITGANFITKKGQVVLLENEGNISLVSRLPKKHIVIVGIDKLVETVEDATQLCRAAALFGTGQDITQYISIISGPSKTADIENQLVMGAQGAREVHLILVDNSRRKMLAEGFGEMLRCINCGSCINSCPVYHQKGNSFGGKKYIGAKGVVTSYFRDGPKGAKDEGSFDCTLCGSCFANCPMQIPLPRMIRTVRQLQQEKGQQTAQNLDMIKKVQEEGNPFGKIKDNEIPDKLYCC